MKISWKISWSRPWYFCIFKRIFESLHNQSCGKRWSKNQEYATTQLTHGTQFSHSSLTFFSWQTSHLRTHKIGQSPKTKQPAWQRHTTQNKDTYHSNCRLNLETRQQQATLAALIRMAIAHGHPPEAACPIHHYYLFWSLHRTQIQAIGKADFQPHQPPITAPVPLILPPLMPLRMPQASPTYPAAISHHTRSSSSHEMQICFLVLGCGATNNLTTKIILTAPHQRLSKFDGSISATFITSMPFVCVSVQTRLMFYSGGRDCTLRLYFAYISIRRTTAWSKMSGKHSVNLCVHLFVLQILTDLDCLSEVSTSCAHKSPAQITQCYDIRRT
jgi:hypothetical protein